MTLLAILYIYILSTMKDSGAKVPPILLAAPFIDIALIVAWFVSIA